MPRALPTPPRFSLSLRRRSRAIPRQDGLRSRGVRVLCYCSGRTERRARTSNWSAPMSKTIAILAPGAMGSAVARRLSENGARVLTSLKGRSEATQKRAAVSGMVGADDDAIAEADIILSIVPAGEAEALAERLAG